MVSFLLLGLVCACSDDRQLGGLITQLQVPQNREQAIEGLLATARAAPARKRKQIRQRVVFALMEAYRQDSKRGQIVTALASLRSRKAEQVFVAALADAERGGEYFEAAIRSARLLGELGIKQRVPELIKALEKAHAKPREDNNTWLERTCIRALGRLGDLRATDVLIMVLGTRPGRQDFFLNKLAARSLGQLRAKRAAPHLVQALGATAHGLLLLEASRRALCRIGPGATKALLLVATGPDRSRATQAMAVLGDLGDASMVPRLVQAVDPTKNKNPELVLAWAETLLRLGHGAVRDDLVALVKSSEASLTTRRRAAELLGWYGGPALEKLLEPTCNQQGHAGAVLCWAAALALTRQGSPQDLQLLDKVAKAADETTRRYLKRYRPRLVLMQRCQARSACHKAELASKDWRVRERAVLFLSRLVASQPGVAATLARLYSAEEHAQVRQAILLGLERSADRAILPPALAKTLTASPPKRKRKAAEAPAAAQRSRMICLGEKLKRNRKGSNQ